MSKQLPPVISAMGKTIFQFLVDDADIAWKCAMDFQAFIEALSQGVGNVVLKSGVNGEKPATFSHSYAAVPSGASIARVIQKTYTFKQIDEAKRILLIGCNTNEYENVEDYNIFVSVAPYGTASTKSLVKIQYTIDLMEKAVPIDMVMLCCVGCCAAMWDQNKRSNAERINLNILCANMSNHFNTYEPSTVSATVIPVAEAAYEV